MRVLLPQSNSPFAPASVHMPGPAFLSCTRNSGVLLFAPPDHLSTVLFLVLIFLPIQLKRLPRRAWLPSWDGVHACILSHFSCVWFFVTLWICSPPGSSVHGILQARILQWIAISGGHPLTMSLNWRTMFLSKWPSLWDWLSFQVLVTSLPSSLTSLGT